VAAAKAKTPLARQTIKFGAVAECDAHNIHDAMSYEERYLSGHSFLI